MKKLSKIILALLIAMFLFDTIAFANENVKIKEVQDQGKNPVVFVSGIDEEVQYSSALIGSVECTNVIANPISEDAVCMKTLILFDNSLSIPEANRDLIKDMVFELIAGRSNGELFSLATFGEDINVIAEFTDDYAQLKAALDGIEFIDQETYLTDVLYELIGDNTFGADQEHIYRRILVISDGVDNKSIGYTTEELSALLQNSGVPIYTVGVYNKKKSNSEELTNMFALSRQTNAEYFLLDELENPMMVLDVLALDRGIVRFEIFPEAAVKDGSEKTITLSIRLENRDINVQVDKVRMAQEIVVEETEKEVQEEPMEEVVADSVQEEKTMNMGVLIGIITLICIFGVAIVLLSVLLVRKKKREDIFVESETPFNNQCVDEGKTEQFFDISQSDDDGTTVQIWSQGRNYLITLTDINVPTKSYQKHITDRLVIGRTAAKVDICIDYDQSVSSKHCAIEKRGDRFYVMDLQSSNGTFLNEGRVLSEVEIYSGSVIKMGRVQMRVEIG